MRVFLVEDHPVTRRELRLALSTLPGLQIAGEAATQDEACAWLQAHGDGWDLAVIDVFLAAGHGFEVLKRCAGRGPQQRAVLLTNYTRSPVRESARRLGADAVFDKSLELEEFLRYCAQLAGERQPASA